MAKHILSCSFGKDSIATALLALQHGEPLDELVYCEVMFSEEISGELPEHNRFIHETAIPYFEQRGIPTRVLRSEKTYLSCFYHVVTRGKTKGMLSGFPLSGRCTIQRDCKLPPIKAYQKALPPDTVQYIGIAADEPKRLARLKPGQISLLDKYHVAEPEARSMCAAEGLLSPLYDFTKRGGCWFCPNASISELRHLYRYHPELWQLLLFSRYQQQTKFLWENHIETMDELLAYKESAEVQIQQLARQRKVLYRQKREPERAAREEKIKSLTQQMKALRHEVYICSDIETDAAEVQEKLRQAEIAAQEERNEVKQDEQRRRSSRSDGAGSLTGYRGGY